MKSNNIRYKLQRKKSHRDAMLANMLCSLVEHRRIRTTLAKAKALRPLADKLMALGVKEGNLYARRRAVRMLGSNGKAKRCAKILFDDLAPLSRDRTGGFTRLMPLGPRNSDSALMALLEWFDEGIEFDEYEEEFANEAIEQKEAEKKVATKEG